MKLELDLPSSVRVAETVDVKGSPLTVLLINDEEALFAQGHRPGDLDAEDWEDIFKIRLARILGKLLLDDQGDTTEWSLTSPTGRETWGHDSVAYTVRLEREIREHGGEV